MIRSVVLEKRTESGDAVIVSVDSEDATTFPGPQETVIFPPVAAVTTAPLSSKEVTLPASVTSTSVTRDPPGGTKPATRTAGVLHGCL